MLQLGSYFADNWWPIVISFLLTIVVTIRMYISGPDCPSNGRVFGKIVLITGGSGGLGLVTAEQLAARGAHIILSCRNMTKGKAAVAAIQQVHPKAKVDLKYLDVSLMSNIREFVKQIELEYTRIDVLINNAGIIFHPYEKTSEGFEITMATNYFGPFLLTHLLLPLLNKSANGRVINVSALAHYSAQLSVCNLSGDAEFKQKEVFGQSKLALLLFTRHLSKMLKSVTNITVNAVNPGLVRNTGHLRNSSMENSLPTKVSVWPWMWLFMKTPVQGSQTILYAAVEPDLKIITGAYFSDCALKQPSQTACNNDLAKEVYEVSCNICGVDSEAIIRELTKINNQKDADQLNK